MCVFEWLTTSGNVALIGNCNDKSAFPVYLSFHFDCFNQLSVVVVFIYFFRFMVEHETCHTVVNPLDTNSLKLIFRNVNRSQSALFSSCCVEIEIHWIQFKAIATMNYFHWMYDKFRSRFFFERISFSYVICNEIKFNFHVPILVISIYVDYLYFWCLTHFVIIFSYKKIQ